MDDYQINRQRVFGPYVRRDLRGIEIGPGYRPTFPKSDGYAVTIVDHCSTAELIAKYDADTNVPADLVSQIEAVDVVWHEASYQNLPGMADGVDYIAASHVIEHTTDLCGFLKDCSALLKEGGTLLLVIPNRLCVLDFYRPASTPGDVLLAHLMPHAYDLKSHLDEVWYGALLDGGGAWSMAHLQATQDSHSPLPQHPISVAGAVWDHLKARDTTVTSGQPYRDAHRWVLDPVNFEELAGFLGAYAETNLRLEAMPEAFGCEFYAVLRKSSGSNATSIDELESIRARAMQARLSRAGAVHSALPA